jgi:hypothetical protein
VGLLRAGVPMERVWVSLGRGSIEVADTPFVLRASRAGAIGGGRPPQLGSVADKDYHSISLEITADSLSS